MKAKEVEEGREYNLGYDDALEKYRELWGERNTVRNNHSYISSRCTAVRGSEIENNILQTIKLLQK